MPAKSLAQLRWVNSPAGHRALGSAGVAEWNAATKGKHLPEKVGAASNKEKAHPVHIDQAQKIASSMVQKRIKM